MKPILFQGSTGAIGDIFLSAHPLVSQKFDHDAKVFAAVQKGGPEHVKDLYSHMSFLEGVIELEDFSSGGYQAYCKEHNYFPCLFMNNLRFLIDTSFQQFRVWFKYDPQPTIEPGDYVGFQVASSSNYERPPIREMDLYVSHVVNYGYKPVFVGGAKDEALFHTLYPGMRERYQISDEQWRFGKDSIYQTLSNIRLFSGMVTFSSWTAYAAVFQGVPTIEIWSMEQWMLHTPMVRRLLGDPVHYHQEFCLGSPTPYMMKIFLYFKENAPVFYGGF